MVTAYINEEFARVKAEEEGKILKVQRSEEKNGPENDTEILSHAAKIYLSNCTDKKRHIVEILLGIIASNSSVTIAEMAKISGKGVTTVKRYLKEFQEAGVLRREGSDTSGEWILL